jgi:glycosyltransferase involved in cell wall biosynthesis
MHIHFVLNTGVSPKAADGTTVMTHILANALEERCRCSVSLSFFDKHSLPSPVKNKIQITAPFGSSGFEDFLLKNEVDIVVISSVSKRNLHFVPEICSSARRHNIKVVSWLHLMPGEEFCRYGSLQRLLFALRKEKAGQILLQLYLLALTLLRPLLRPFARRWLRKKYRIRYNNSEVSVLHSKYAFEDYAKIAGAKNYGKLYDIGSSLSLTQTFSEAELKQKQKEVIIVARLDEPMKRISIALKVWKIIEKREELSAWKLTIVGRGADADFYSELISKLRLKRCTLAGYVEEQPYKSASIFMMTSAFEAWGLTVTESLQMGVVPVVFDSFGTIHHLIESGENGIVVPNNNIKAFANAMIALMTNDAERERMAKNALISSERFTLDKVADRWMNLLINLKNNTL